jgi:large subunit ribosomal protein L27
MAHKKAGGAAHNLNDSNPKYLGIKLSDGMTAKAGSILVRQRGTKILAGKNVFVGNDHTLYADKAGLVTYTDRRKGNFDGTFKRLKVANVTE